MSESEQAWHQFIEGIGSEKNPFRVYLDGPNGEHIRYTEGLIAAIPLLNALQQERDQLREALEAFMAYYRPPQIHPLLYDSQQERAWSLADAALTATQPEAERRAASGEEEKRFRVEPFLDPSGRVLLVDAQEDGLYSVGMSPQTAEHNAAVLNALQADNDALKQERDRYREALEDIIAPSGYSLTTQIVSEHRLIALHAITPEKGK